MIKTQRIPIFLGIIVTLTFLPSKPLISAAANVCRLSTQERVIYVSQFATGTNDGSSWRNAFNDLQSALDAAAASSGGDQIWIAEGSYEPVSGAYTLTSNITLLGGFSGVEGNRKERKPKHHDTVLGSSNNSFRVLFADSLENVIIDGVTVAGGKATGKLGADALDVSNEVRGGGLLALSSDIAVCHVTFQNNQAKKFGGAIYQEGGELHIRGSLFQNNTVLRGVNEVHDDLSEADTDGGAIAIHDSDLLVKTSAFYGNVAGDDGGAIASRRTNIEIDRGDFIGNQAIGTVLPAQLPSLTDDFITSTGGRSQFRTSRSVVTKARLRLSSDLNSAAIKAQSAVRAIFLVPQVV